MISWAEAAPPPPGLTNACSASINGRPVIIYDDPETGDQWFLDEDGDFHKITEGPELECGESNSSPVGLLQNPVPLDGAPQSSTSISFDFAFSDEENTAFVRFVLPVANIENYTPAAELPFLVSETVIQVFPSGDLQITYTGTISDVLGALWWTGIQSLDFEDPTVGQVHIQWANDINLVTIETPLGNRTIAMELSNPDFQP